MGFYQKEMFSARDWIIIPILSGYVLFMYEASPHVAFLGIGSI
jgi:hypothetical protein